MPLTTPLSELPGVGPAKLRALTALDLRTVGDLLHYFPRDYQYISAQADIADLQPNTICTATGEVIAVNYVSGPRPRFEATLDDGTGKLALTFFHGAYLRTRIHPGMHLKVKGKLRTFRNLPQMQNPKWSAVDAPAEPGVVPIGATSPSPHPTSDISQPTSPPALQPLYPATAALTSDALSKLIESALPLALPQITETLPEGLLRRRELLPRADAYRLIHRPHSKADAIAARKRLVYDELMVLQLGLALSRQNTRPGGGAPILRCDKLLDQRIRARFPFDLTPGQTHAIHEILADLTSGRKPMNRLLQGDVGSGKTAVALYAMLVAVANKMQAAILAPTEVLAEQHYLSLSRFLKDSAVTVELFTSRTKRQSKGAINRALADGRVHLAVGTQALLHDDIAFANLGLVVIDEQHRLGVQQRAKLRGKTGANVSPHYLVMTATPIPRTLALSYFADFDLSTIDELPPGRSPITTHLIQPNRHADAWTFLKQHVSQGRQAFIVTPQIGSEDPPDRPYDDVRRTPPAKSPPRPPGELDGAPAGEGSGRPPVPNTKDRPPLLLPSEELDGTPPGEGSGLNSLPPPTSSTSSLLAAHAHLASGPLKSLRILTLHGQMPPEQKQQVMDAFRAGQADVLLATTVIEVGIDVPNATVIAILDADRFGLSQLHQLRGRVGRGPHPSHCLLLPGENTLSSATGPDTLARLQALIQTTSGFEIAEIDLRLRGPGQFFGTRQHGLPEFRLADLASESHLLHDAREDAQWILTRDPKLSAPELQTLRGEILRDFADAIPLASVG